MRSPFLRCLILILSGLLVTTCTLNDPEYILDFDRVSSTPGNLQAIPLNLFDMRLNWEVVNSENIESYSIFRSVKDSEENFRNVAGFIEIDERSINSEEETVNYIDSTAIPYKWNYYYIVANRGDQTSLHSDTVGCLFTMPAPSFSAEIGGVEMNQIMQRVAIQNMDFNGVVISRIHEKDTVQHELSRINTDTIFTLADTMQFDEDSVLETFKGRSLHAYKDIEPNIEYSYQAKSFMIRDQEKRYSDTSSALHVTLDREYPTSFMSLPLSNTQARLYFSNFAVWPYDSVLIYEYETDSLQFKHSFSIAEGDIYQNNAGEISLVFDLPFITSEPTPVKAIFWGPSSHTASQENLDQIDSSIVSSLDVPGFRLVEEGILFPSCDSGIMNNNCAGDGFQIDRFYLSIFETTNMTTSEWPPALNEMPVENVSWDSAVGFCELLGIRYPEYEFNLPTEAEWEFSAKHNIIDNRNYTYPWGETVDIYHANYANSNTNVTPVGSYPYPGFSGQYDLAGNVMEWVYSSYDEVFDPNLPNQIESEWKVIRGGAYWQNPADIETTARSFLPRDTESDGLGFRVAMRRRQ